MKFRNHPQDYAVATPEYRLRPPNAGSAGLLRTLQHLEFGLDRRKAFGKAFILDAGIGRHLAHGLELVARDEVLRLQPALDHEAGLCLDLLADSTKGGHGTGRGARKVVEDAVVGLHAGIMAAGAVELQVPEASAYNRTAFRERVVP